MSSGDRIALPGELYRNEETRNVRGRDFVRVSGFAEANERLVLPQTGGCFAKFRRFFKVRVSSIFNFSNNLSSNGIDLCVKFDDKPLLDGDTQSESVSWQKNSERVLVGPSRFLE